MKDMGEGRLRFIRGGIFRKGFYVIKLDKVQNVGFKERMIRKEELNAAKAEIGQRLEACDPEIVPGGLRWKNRKGALWMQGVFLWRNIDEYGTIITGMLCLLVQVL